MIEEENYRNIFLFLRNIMTIKFVENSIFDLQKDEEKNNFKIYLVVSKK